MVSLKERERAWCQICHADVQAFCLVHVEMPATNMMIAQHIPLCARHVEEYEAARRVPICRWCGKPLTHGMQEDNCPSNPANH